MARRGRSGATAHKSWLVVGGQAAAVDAAASALGSGLTSFDLPQTLLRVRGRVQVQLDAAAVDERVTVAMGLIVVPDRAASVGITAVPLPSSNGEDDWLWHGFAMVTSGAEAAIVPDALIATIEIDSKAMRKVKPDESLVFVVESVSAATVDQGGSFDVIYGYRCLSAG